MLTSMSATCCTWWQHTACEWCCALPVASAPAGTLKSMHAACRNSQPHWSPAHSPCTEHTNYTVQVQSMPILHQACLLVPPRLLTKGTRHLLLLLLLLLLLQESASCATHAAAGAAADHKHWCGGQAVVWPQQQWQHSPDGGCIWHQGLAGCRRVWKALVRCCGLMQRGGTCNTHTVMYVVLGRCQQPGVARVRHWEAAATSCCFWRCPYLHGCSSD